MEQWHKDSRKEPVITERQLRKEINAECEKLYTFSLYGYFLPV